MTQVSISDDYHRRQAHPYDPEVFLAWHNACDCFSLGTSGNCWKLVMNIGLTSAGSVVAAATAIDHTGVNLWRGMDAADGAPVFYMLMFASYADSIWRT